MRNIFDKTKYKPLPMGDGQTLALRLQASQFYNTYSLILLNLGWVANNPFNFLPLCNIPYNTGMTSLQDLADKTQSFQISGATLGLAKRLRVPDDFFQLSQAISISITI